MKTAISVPDDTFDRATQCANVLGMSRSEFFTVAAQRYLEAMEAEQLTAQIDAALSITEEDESTRFAVEAGQKRLAEEPEW